MELKTILNRCHRFKSFVYGTIYFDGDDRLHVAVMPRKRSKGVCSGCDRPGPTYDTAKTPRGFVFVPLWGFAVWLWYCMRRVDCAKCGVTVEKVPWAEGKNATCNAYRLFLAGAAPVLERSRAYLPNKLGRRVPPPVRIVFGRPDALFGPRSQPSFRPRHGPQGLCVDYVRATGCDRLARAAAPNGGSPADEARGALDVAASVDCDARKCAKGTGAVSGPV